MPISKNELIMMSDFCISLSEGTVPYGRIGLCGNFIVEFEKRIDQVVPQELYVRWAEFSGDKVYPVPGPKRTSPMEFYYHCRRYDILWSGEYGESRKRLCMFIANEIDKLSIDTTDGLMLF